MRIMTVQIEELIMHNLVVWFFVFLFSFFCLIILSLDFKETLEKVYKNEY